jgi:hypothetical protein
MMTKVTTIAKEEKVLRNSSSKRLCFCKYNTLRINPIEAGISKMTNMTVKITGKPNIINPSLFVTLIARNKKRVNDHDNSPDQYIYWDSLPFGIVVE